MIDVLPVQALLVGWPIQAYQYNGSVFAFFRARFTVRQRWYYLAQSDLPLLSGWRPCVAPVCVRRAAGFPKGRRIKVAVVNDLFNWPGRVAI